MRSGFRESDCNPQSAIETGGHLSQRLGILGGTFNPIHYGHLAAAEEVRDRLKLDRVLFIPSFFLLINRKKIVPSAVQRMEMVTARDDRATRFLSLRTSRSNAGGRSYTIDTIEALRQAYPGAELYFITGLDSFLEIQTWQEWERLLTLVSFCGAVEAGISIR